MKKISGIALAYIIIVVVVCVCALYVDSRLKPLCHWLMNFTVPAVAIIALAVVTFRRGRQGPNQ